MPFYNKYIQPKHPALEAEFVTKVTYIKEKMRTRENEIWGRWLTEERMKKSNEFSPTSIKSIIAYCNKFPETLIRYHGSI